MLPTGCRTRCRIRSMEGLCAAALRRLRTSVVRRGSRAAIVVRRTVAGVTAAVLRLWVASVLGGGELVYASRPSVVPNPATEAVRAEAGPRKACPTGPDARDSAKALAIHIAETRTNMPVGVVIEKASSTPEAAIESGAKVAEAVV